MSIHRRQFLGLSSFVLMSFPVGSQLSAQTASAAPQSGAAGPGQPDASFPSHPAAVVREMVTVSHGNLARVKELLDRWPALARAAIDWGFGDWEDALGAASHVGNRAIAELLLAHGARPTIFSAAMLGQLDIVKAFVVASPGIEATHGPHSITLFRHAMAGGAGARPVVEYLRTLPAADRRPAEQPITVDELKALTGAYAFGAGTGDRLIVEENRGILSIVRPGSSARNLVHLGERAFYPVGATSVRVRFGERAGKATVTVHDPDVVVIAERA
jgi:hypothetical protein